jgi:hypothetical protein
LRDRIASTVARFTNVATDATRSSVKKMALRFRKNEDPEVVGDHLLDLRPLSLRARLREAFEGRFDLLRGHSERR